MACFDFDTPITKNIKLKAKWLDPTVTEITVEFTGAGEAVINNRWGGEITVDDEPTPVGASRSVTVTAGQQMVIAESDPDAFRTWSSDQKPFISGVEAKIVSMPEMNKFTVADDGEEAGDYFFFCFNDAGTITEYPAGSFDTSKIQKFGAYCFRYFNRANTTLTALPAGSFNFDSMVIGGTHFCQNFSREATKLTELPAGSFNFPLLVDIGGNMFASFNLNGPITKLPSGSFQFPKLSTVGGGFGYYFNGNGKIQELPKDSFDVSTVTNCSGSMFEAFNGVAGAGALGMLQRDNTSYTNTKNMTSTPTVATYYPSGSETVNPGGLFHWKMSQSY